jgi:hypothetical protein
MAIVDANSAQAAGISQTAATTPESGQSSTPDLTGYSKEQLSDMLRADGSNGSAAQVETAPPIGQEVPKQEVGPEVKPIAPAINVPDKFKNPDGSVNVDSLLKSYGEAEKVVGRQLNVESQLNQLTQQNQQLQQALEQIKQSVPQPEPEPELTAEQISQMTPEQFQSHVDQKIETKFQSMLAQQELQQKIDASINEVSQYDGAKELEADITKVLQSNVFQRSPDAPKMAYYAALGGKMPQLVSQSRNMGYSEGYAAAKAEMLKGVDSGRASGPVESGNLSEQQIAGLSRADHEKLLPRFY